MANRVVWNGEGAKDHVRGKAVTLLTRAAQACERKARDLLSVSGTGRSGKGSRKAYGAFPSAPGEPPHKQLGRLRSSVTYEVDEQALIARVGTNLDYGKFLELGTSKGLAPRPWLRRALDEVSTQINTILAGINKD